MILMLFLCKRDLPFSVSYASFSSLHAEIKLPRLLSPLSCIIISQSCNIASGRKRAIRGKVEHKLGFNTNLQTRNRGFPKSTCLTHHSIRCIPHRPMSLQIPLPCSSPSPGWPRGSIPPVWCRKESGTEETAIGEAIGIQSTRAHPVALLRLPAPLSVSHTSQDHTALESSNEKEKGEEVEREGAPRTRSVKIGLFGVFLWFSLVSLRMISFLFLRQMTRKPLLLSCAMCLLLLYNGHQSLCNMSPFLSSPPLF